jgi:chromate reductase
MKSTGKKLPTIVFMDSNAQRYSSDPPRRVIAKPIRVLGFAGSLRKSSYNKQLLRTAGKLVPDFTQLELFEIDSIPLYNQDAEVLGVPQSVMTFKAKIKNADALLIATPEYSHSFPGVLKNAIDWASRPYGDNSFDGKPVAVLSATPGFFGGTAAQDQLKQVLMALNMHPITQPAVIVTSAQEKFDPDGNLTDPNARLFIKLLLANLVGFARKLSEEPLLEATAKA